MKKFKDFNPKKLQNLSMKRMNRHKRRKFAVKTHEAIYTNFEDFSVPDEPKWVEHIPGGKSQGMKPEDFNQDQLEKGKKVQMEHTNDPMFATEIAMDHLAEWDPLPYYDYLDRMEKEMDEERNKEKQTEKNNIYLKKNNFNMKTKFNQFVNEAENTQRSKKDDKFKFQIEYSPEIVDELEIHNIKKSGDKEDGDWILLNVLTLEYSFMDEPIEGIKLMDESRFQHIMGNL